MSTPTNPHNTPTPPPLPGVNLTNPDRLPGEEVPVNPDASAPEGFSTGQSIPPNWKPSLSLVDGKVATTAILKNIAEELQQLRAIISRMG